MEISNMLDREFKVLVMKILTRLEKSIEDVKKIFNKGTENIEKKQTEKNSITEMKNTINGINRKLKEAVKGTQ